MSQKWIIALTDEELGKPAAKRLSLTDLCARMGFEIRERGRAAITVQGERAHLAKLRTELAGRADISPYRGLKIL
ncbi:MAG TPA: hypothetical protein VM915_12060 [Verrucomicrobiae bacterium]|nr:hypothetical protein [Verrucomicrobiae bacterium]